MAKQKSLREYYKGPTDEIKCPGEAHSNAFIDNCGTCAPRWGKVSVPVGCATVEQAQVVWQRWKDWALEQENARKMKKAGLTVSNKTVDAKEKHGPLCLCRDCQRVWPRRPVSPAAADTSDHPPDCPCTTCDDEWREASEEQGEPGPRGR